MATSARTTPTALPPTAATRPRFGEARRFLRHRGAVIGFVVLLFMVLVALFAGQIATADPGALAPQNRLQPPSAAHLFGTDNFGRDLFSRVVFGAQISLIVGATVSVITFLTGTLVGLLAGYYRRLDGPLMRVMDSMMAFPGIVLAIAIMAAMGPSMLNVIITLSIVYTPRVARLVRSVVLTIREMQYVEAARCIGTANERILLRHILPNCLSPLIVQSTFVFAEAVLGEAGLSFLGVGVPPYIPTWGNILGESRTYLREAPWTMLFPGIALSLTVMALNLLGDGVRDLIDPRLRRL